MIQKVKAPAKINIGLKILGRRPDGYHDILSIFQTVNLFDELSADLSDKPGLICDNPEIPTDETNLVLKAEKEFLFSAGFSKHACFNLKKRIPAGAGLGGGSSDCAATLRVLNKIHNEILSESELVSCAERLGSDVPFLLKGGSAIVSGRGERIEPVAWPFEFKYLLVYPGFQVSTAWAYNNLKKTENEYLSYEKMLNMLRDGKLKRNELLQSIENDFEVTVFEEYPILSGIKNTILKNGALSAFMSGSGSTILGLFENIEKARFCAEKMKNENFSIFIAEPFNNPDRIDL